MAVLLWVTISFTTWVKKHSLLTNIWQLVVQVVITVIWQLNRCIQSCSSKHSIVMKQFLFVGTCSHTASVLFYLEAVVRIQGTRPTCTQEKCQWIIPSYLKNTEYLRIKNMDFTSVHGKKRKLDETICQDSNNETCIDLSKPQQEVQSLQNQRWTCCLQIWTSEVPNHWPCYWFQNTLI